MKIFSFLLFLCVNKFVTAANSPISVPGRKFSDGDDEDDVNVTIGGSKRKFCETVPQQNTEASQSQPTIAQTQTIMQPQEISQTQTITQTTITTTTTSNKVHRSSYFYTTIKKVFDDFNTKVVPNYPDPVDEFLDKLIRRSFYIKLSNTIDSSEIWLWSLPCTVGLSCSWHTEAFFFFMMNNVKIAEHVLIEYFQYLKERWALKYQYQSPYNDPYMIVICKYAIAESYVDLFEEALNSITKEESGANILLLLREKGEETEGNVYWQLMCLRVVEKFPRVVYASELRMDDFLGASLPSPAVFIHFLPILRTLLIKSPTEFQADLDYFDMFALFQSGDLENMLPMGLGGLKIVNQMFLRSHINLSAFTIEKDPLRQEIFERLFDALFLGFQPLDFVKLLFDQKSFSIFEAFLKYSKEPLSENLIISILEYFLINTEDYDNGNFISALIAHVDISKTIWDSVLIKLDGKGKAIALFNQYKLLNHHVKQDKSGIIDLSRDGIVKFKINSNLIDIIADRMKKPIQLELARVFLSRSCGIPLELTEVTDFTSEPYEWREVVGFINFYVERAAGIAKFPGASHVVFQL